MNSGSFDQSPNLNDVLCGWAESNVARQPRGSEEEEDRLKETLADAMVESPVKDCGPDSMREGTLCFYQIDWKWSFYWLTDGDRTKTVRKA